MVRLLALAGLLAGCNSLLGVHDFQPDADTCTGTCECRVDADCPDPHATCIDGGTTRTCTCVAGYSPTDGSCAWTGVVANSSFDSLTGWDVAGPVAIDPTLTDPYLAMDVGEAVVTETPGCPKVPGVHQTVTMPRRERAEPLVIQSTYGFGLNSGHNFDTGRLEHGIAGAWNATPFAYSRFEHARTCLGEKAYASATSLGLGEPRPFTATVDEDGQCFPQDETFSIAALDIVPALPDECSPVGTIVNGDAEGSGGWTFQPPPAGCIAGYVEGVGLNGSRGIRLFAQHRCDVAEATTQVSIPMDPTKSPVLALYHSEAGNKVNISVDGHRLLVTTNTNQVEKFCLPAYMRGGSYLLAAYAYDASSGACNDVTNDDLVIDNVALSDDPACATTEALTDPGFESQLGLIGATADSAYSGASARVVTDANAHGGTHDLQLSVSSNCSFANYEVPVVIPAPDATGGPALTFWYRAPGTMSQFYGQSYKGTFTPVRDAAWHPGVVCLDPRRARQPATTTFGQHLSIVGTCGTFQGSETTALDDFAVTTSAACPST